MVSIHFITFYFAVNVPRGCGKQIVSITGSGQGGEES